MEIVKSLGKPRTRIKLKEQINEITEIVPYWLTDESSSEKWYNYKDNLESEYFTNFSFKYLIQILSEEFGDIC